MAYIWQQHLASKIISPLPPSLVTEAIIISINAAVVGLSAETPIARIVLKRLKMFEDWGSETENIRETVGKGRKN